MTTVSNPTLVSSASNFTVYKNGDVYYAQTKSGAVSQNTSAVELIQDCIDNLTSGRTAKERVLLRGDFEIDDSIVMASYTILQLDGKVTLADNADCEFITGDAITNFEVVGGIWDGNRANQTAGIDVTGFNFDECDDFVINGVTMHDVFYSATSDGDAIYMYDCTRAAVKNCTIYNCCYSGGGGIKAYGCNDCQVRDNVVHDCVYGIAFRTLSNSVAETVYRNIITNNLLYHNSNAGIVVMNDEGGTDHADWNMVSDNILYDCGTSGVRCLSTNTDYVTISGNIIYESGTHTSAGGIYFYSQNSNIQGNLIYNVGGDGIIGCGSGNVVTNNTIHKTRTALKGGIILADSDENVVSNNTIDDPAAYGISLKSATNSDTNLIQGNVIIDPGADWIEIPEVASTGNRILGNMCLGTSTGGGLAIHDQGTSTYIGEDNQGYVNKAEGTATILNGQTSIAVTHGLINGTTKLTPTKMVATGSSADTASLYIDTIGDTTFTINVAVAVGGNRPVYWYAKV